MSKTSWSADEANLGRCNTADDVRAAIARARTERKALRVAGAQHSAPRAVFPSANEPSIRIKLGGDLRAVTVVEENKADGYMVVRAGAGCNLGIDPSDKDSNAWNSFNRQVDAWGYALPLVGGMSHQTLGGFMMTGTAGGSLQYGFADVLESFEFVDGQGRTQVVAKGSDEFYAAAVSMGLYGVVTHLTLKLPKNYLVKGSEQIVATKDSMLADAARLMAALREHTYSHVVWFPETGVDRVLEFVAAQTSNDDVLERYTHVLDSRWMNYAAAAVLYSVNVLESTRSGVLHNVAGQLLKLINPIGKPKTFCDHWYLALPNDDQVLIDMLMRVQFTEIWIDVARTEQVLGAVQDLFARDPRAAGNFGVEVYGAKASPFWMSQSYGHDVIRIDPYWWEFNPTGKLEDFFTKYWNVLLTIPTARLHWGKHFPAVGTRFGDVTIGPDYVAKAFPKFGDWLKLRQTYDPDQVFMTSYWRSLLGIAS